MVVALPEDESGGAGTRPTAATTPSCRAMLEPNPRVATADRDHSVVSKPCDT